MREIPKFAGSSCFEICHHENCKGLLLNIHRGNSLYSRSLRNHHVRTLITDSYKDDIPRISERTIRGRPTNASQGRPNRTTDVDEATYDTDSEESQFHNPKIVRKQQPQIIARKLPAPRTAASNVRKVVKKQANRRPVLDRRRSS